jgi:hypothetical protein
MRHRQRLHRRGQRGTRHRRQSAAGLARLHRRIRCQRMDFLHKATTDLAKTESVIVVEDLSVRGMIRNRHLSRSICGRRVGRVPPDAGLQDHLVRVSADRRAALLPVYQDLFGLRPRQGGDPA